MQPGRCPNLVAVFAALGFTIVVQDRGMTMKRRFTDRWVKSLKPAPQGKRVEHWDTAVPNFGIRITERGHKTYVLYTRFPGSRCSVRREIGNASKLPLADARMVAREWLRQVELGIDPRAQQRAEDQRRQHTFELVAKAWFKDAVVRMANAEEIERAVRFNFVNRWRTRPICSITTVEIRDIVKAKALGHAPAPGAKKMGPAPAQAANILGFVKRLFSWAIDQHIYGLEKNPADALRGERLIGPKVRRKRVLSDSELREVCRGR